MSRSWSALESRPNISTRPGTGVKTKPSETGLNALRVPPFLGRVFDSVGGAWDVVTGNAVDAVHDAVTYASSATRFAADAMTFGYLPVYHLPLPTWAPMRDIFLAPTDEGERSKRFQVFIWVPFFHIHVVILIVVVAFGLI